MTRKTIVTASTILLVALALVLAGACGSDEAQEKNGKARKGVLDAIEKKLA